MADSLRREIEDFYYAEAELLDNRQFREWFKLLADDVRYWMPIRHNPLERSSDIQDELSKAGEGFYFDDDKASLRIRVERVYARNAWAEMPPSRTRYLISNVRIKKDNGSAIEVHANFIVYRTRMETDQDIFVGERQDVLRRMNGTFQIARRTIILDQAVLSAKNISVFLCDSAPLFGLSGAIHCAPFRGDAEANSREGAMNRAPTTNEIRQPTTSPAVSSITGI